MIRPPQRLSPLHSALKHLHPHWGEIAGMPVPLDFGDPMAERAQAALLALCDVSALPRLTLKGPGAKAFLEKQSLSVPEEVYAWSPLPDDGLVVRTGTAEFFLEEGPGGDSLTRLEQAIGNSLYRVLRQDAALLLSGRRAIEVLAQTCGIDLTPRPPHWLVNGASHHSSLTARSSLGKEEPNPQIGSAESSVAVSRTFGEEESGRVPTSPFPVSAANELGKGAGGLGRMIMTRIAGVSCAVLVRECNSIPAYQLWADGSYGLYLWETLLEIVMGLGGGPVGLSCFFPNLAVEG